MKTLNKIALAAAVAASLAGVAYAQDGDFGAGPCGGGPMAHRHGGMRDHGARMEQRLASIKSELKITPAQESAWTAFESTVKAQVKSMPRGPEQRKQFANLTAPERADLRAKRMQERAQGAQAIAQAVKNLYAQLTPEQKQTADQLMMGRHAG